MEAKFRPEKAGHARFDEAECEKMGNAAHEEDRVRGRATRLPVTTTERVQSAVLLTSPRIKRCLTTATTFPVHTSLPGSRLGRATASPACNISLTVDGLQVTPHATPTNPGALYSPSALARRNHL
jgi:hypothetical protein